MSDSGALHRCQAAMAAAIRHWSAFGGRAVDPPFAWLTERMELLGLGTPGQRSANGSCRMIACADGWIAANLPRESDLSLVAALVESWPADDPWRQLEQAALSLSAAHLVERAGLLGLAIAKVGESGPLHVLPSLDEPGQCWDRQPRVLDLSALWAGPLCGAILAAAGCAVTKVETLDRPDSTARRCTAFDDRLNGAKQRLAIDPAQPVHWAMLEERIAAADIVITSARRRGLASLGIADALDRMAGCWIEITAHSDPRRIGFGDDCAAAAGLVDWRAGVPHFLGDAVADPLTGLAAATGALHALATGRGGHRPVHLASVARMAAHG